MINETIEIKIAALQLRVSTLMAELNAELKEANSHSDLETLGEAADRLFF